MLSVSFIDRIVSLRIPQADIEQCAREFHRMAIIKRERLNGARRLAWEGYCHWTGRSTTFWRDRVLGKLANTGRDYSSIPHYDEIAEAVAAEFPEWDGRNDDLWEFLGERYERLPTLAEFCGEAEEYLLRQQEMEADTPF